LVPTLCHGVRWWLATKIFGRELRTMDVN
jgi:hypothetical protein